MSRKPAKPIYAFHRFLKGIYAYYLDKGVPSKTAKVKMFKETYDICFDFAKDEEEAPDHVLVTTMQHASRHLNQRGAELTKIAKQNPEQSEEILKLLQTIKQAKDASDEFIATYEGVK